VVDFDEFEHISPIEFLGNDSIHILILSDQVLYVFILSLADPLEDLFLILFLQTQEFFPPSLVLEYLLLQQHQALFSL
jgi:hypothetical protein